MRFISGGKEEGVNCFRKKNGVQEYEEEEEEEEEAEEEEEEEEVKQEEHEKEKEAESGVWSFPLSVCL